MPQRRVFIWLFIVRLYKWEGGGGCSILRWKWLVVNIDCHCSERKRKRERNERKQVHLPQVYNPEITVCSGACLTALGAACASLLISSAPAVQELIRRFSESITLLSKVSLPERDTRACTCAHVYIKKNTYTHRYTKPIHPSVVNTHSKRLIAQPLTHQSWTRPCPSLRGLIQLGRWLLTGLH